MSCHILYLQKISKLSYYIFVKVHLLTFRASRDAVFSNSSVCQTFRPWGSSSVTGGGLQGVFIYRHLFPPFSITSSVMSPFTSPSSGNDVTDDITDEVIENGGGNMPINEDTLKTTTSH